MDVPRRQVIDAHHHVWDLGCNYHPWLVDEPMIPFRYGDYSAIRRTYLLGDYLADTADFELVTSVYVEAEWDPSDPIGETRWIHAVADRHGFPGAVVSKVWLDREDAAEVIAAQAGFERVRSVRHKPRAARLREDAERGLPGSMDDERWREGFSLLGRHGLMFDLQTPWWHFDAAAGLAQDFPGTPIIVNHAGLPADRSAEGLAGWRAALETLARQPNANLKITGIGVPGRAWTAELNAEVVRDAIRIFGVRRCMLGSNFPVDSLVARFSDIFRGFEAITSAMSESERNALFHDNALRIYRPLLRS